MEQKRNHQTASFFKERIAKKDFLKDQYSSSLQQFRAHSITSTSKNTGSQLTAIKAGSVSVVNPQSLKASETSRLGQSPHMPNKHEELLYKEVEGERNFDLAATQSLKNRHSSNLLPSRSINRALSQSSDQFEMFYPVSEEAAEVPVNIHPQQNVFNFNGSDIQISSDFDSGNLASAELLEKNFFGLQISTDSMPFRKDGQFRTWFHFSVTGVQQNETLQFNIKRMNHQSKLFANGLKPVYKVDGSMKAYKRIPGDLSFITYPEGFSITFSHKFNCGLGDVTYFAFTYPFSYQEILSQSENLVKKFSGHRDIYIH